MFEQLGMVVHIQYHSITSGGGGRRRIISLKPIWAAEQDTVSKNYLKRWDGLRFSLAIVFNSSTSVARNMSCYSLFLT